MRRTPITTRAKVTALTNPDPNFVSLVIAGANQTPFRSVKAEVTAVRVTKEEWSDMLVTFKADGHDIAALFFPADKFSDEAAVKAWLTDGGYDFEDATFSNEDHGITVKSADEFQDDTDREIEIEGGVTVKVALRADAIAKTEASDDPAPEADSAGSKVQPVAKSEDATETVVEPEAEAEPVEALKADDIEQAQKALYQINHIVEVVAVLRAIAEDMAYDGDSPALSAVKAAGANMLAALSAAVGSDVADLAEAFKAAIEAAKAEADPETDLEAEPLADVEVEKAEDAPVIEDVSATDPEVVEPEAVAKDNPATPSLADVMEAITNLTASVKDVTAVAEEASAKAQAAHSRIDGEEVKAEAKANTQSVRRSADVEGPVGDSLAGKASNPSDAEHRRRAGRDLVGI